MTFNSVQLNRFTGAVFTVLGFVLLGSETDAHLGICLLAGMGIFVGGVFTGAATRE
jgi:hypothetical protein